MKVQRFLNFNDELMQICDKLPLDVLGANLLRILRGDGIESMTAKIRNMENLKDLDHLCVNRKWVEGTDWNSGISADFPFGLKILIDVRGI